MIGVFIAFYSTIVHSIIRYNLLANRGFCMSYKFEEEKDLIINSIVDQILQKMPTDQALLCAEFVRQLYGTVALTDLAELREEDLYGAAVNFWSLIQCRAPEETKIRIYNPEFERHAWQTTHTVVEVIMQDMPFLVDSLRMVIQRMGLSCHLAIHMGGFRVKRNAAHCITEILPRGLKEEQGISIEAPIFLEIDRQTDTTVLQQLYESFKRVLEENRAVVEDWSVMRTRVREAATELAKTDTVLDPEEAEETQLFLHWIEDHHFTFLGVRDYALIRKGSDMVLQPLVDTGLGILRPGLSQSSVRRISSMTPEARELILSNRALVMSKINAEATVHRRADPDYIGIKRYDENNEVIGERRIIGLYTSEAYNTNPKYIPFLRHKVAKVLSNSGLNAKSHAGKILLNILETLPRDLLIQASEDELLEIAMGIYYMQDRPRIRLFARADVYRRFVTCLVFVPKERYNAELRHAMQAILAEYFHSTEITFSTWFPESTLARLHFIVKTNPDDEMTWDFKEVEKKLIEAGRSWTDDLQHLLLDMFGEEEGNNLAVRYKNAFSRSYIEMFSPRTAVSDIKHIETLSPENPLITNFYCPMDELASYFRLKVYQRDKTIPLSDVMPIVEHLGMRAISERPYMLRLDDGKETWVSEFILQYTREVAFDVDEIKGLFQSSFAAVWTGLAENDGFNELVLAAGLPWRHVSILRAYAKYFKQIRFTFSQEYIELALSNNPDIALKLIALFDTRFNPEENAQRAQAMEAIVAEIMQALDSVANLDEDKIIRHYVHAIMATLRTNYYQKDSEGKDKSYLSFKLHSPSIPGLPKPHPQFEIFVYSPRFEGVHLRIGMVARGGLRWSDRPEDYRTEILGLVKAQQVKNAVIVPGGAKGGFFPKRMPVNGTREAILTEAIVCYQSFIRGLLDLTDNYLQGVVVKPPQVKTYDNDDPYLVVAADKGTATFSDIANTISFEYGFWLGDAFASGGSVGYDHKKIGITARGAWESVRRHFFEMNKNMDLEDFTVVGIGDMSGDVFGNGMLLSRHIQLLGAFNHLHIFIDPTPDALISYKERERLFQLPRSSWSDYDKKLISKGGGVFNRNLKSIPVSKEMKQCFGITQSSIEPNELIRMILRAPVDLLWSGGIGTYVKASHETDLDVGDRTNDATRILANQLQCKVVGEGGNLGLTQLARIEYELQGGLIYTDFIDNSGGVNCSDKEVNIKILLNAIVAAGDLTFKQRNDLLSEMTDEVASLVLHDNFAQPRAISYAATQTHQSLDFYVRYINELEHSGKLDRALEFLPDEKALTERKLLGKGLGRPSIAVLVCYSKTLLKEQILASDIPEDLFLKSMLIEYFPKPLQQRFSAQMQQHPLKREIIATTLSNMIVNELGSIFVYRMQDETGASVAAIVRAFIITRTTLNFAAIWKKIDGLESLITVEQQNEIILLYVRLFRRVTRWFLKNQRVELAINKAVKRYEPGVMELKKALPDILGEGLRKQYDKHYTQYMERGIDAAFAHELSLARFLFPVMDMIEVAHCLALTVTQIAEGYFMLGEFLELSWIRSQIIAHPIENNWESLSREALRDDLDSQQRELTVGIFRLDKPTAGFSSAFAHWSEDQAGLIDRWWHVLADLRSATTLNYTMFFVAIRELLDLTQSTLRRIDQPKKQE